MLHDTVTVTRTKALAAPATALAIARAVSHERRIRPHYTVGESASDQTICNVLDEHYDAAGGIPLQPPNLIHNHRDLLDFELHCTGTESLFAADIWQFHYADWVHAAVSVCSRMVARRDHRPGRKPRLLLPARRHTDVRHVVAPAHPH